MSGAPPPPPPPPPGVPPPHAPPGLPPPPPPHPGAATAATAAGLPPPLPPGGMLPPPPGAPGLPPPPMGPPMGPPVAIIPPAPVGAVPPAPTGAPMPPPPVQVQAQGTSTHAGTTTIVRPASVVVTHIPPHLAVHHRCLRELAFAALAADGKSSGGGGSSKGVCRGVALHKIDIPNGISAADDGKENGTSGKKKDAATARMAVASVQMSSVEGARFLARTWNALASAAKGDGATPASLKEMRSYVALPVGVAEEEEDGGEDIGAEVIEQVRKVERGLFRQYQEANKSENGGSTGDTSTDGGAKDANKKKDEEKEGEEVDKSAGGAATSDENSSNTIADTNDAAVVKIDVSKVAAAAGGGEYDEEHDPLNAPEVLAAVAAFKRRNNERDAHLRKRRVEIVDRRLAEETQKAKARLVQMEEGRKKAEADRAARAVMASVGVDVGDGAEKEGAAAAAAPDAVDTGKRGVSNLPTWMSKGEAAGSTDSAAAPPSQVTKTEETKAIEGEESNSRKRKFVPSEANRDINTRKQRIDAGEGMSMAEIRAANEAADKKKAAAATTKEEILKAGVTFPAVPADSVPKVKQYVTDQIVELLGEAEDSMINFVLGALTVPKSPAGCLVSSMLEEMQPVLDEDAEDFVVDLYRTVAGLA